MGAASRLAAASSVLALLACGANETPQPAVDGGFDALECLPNLDGVLTADELPAAAGLTADYYVSTDQTVDLDGAVDARGVRVWSMAEVGGAPRDTLDVSAARDRWYADSFPTDALVAPLGTDGAAETIFTIDGDGMWAWGIASAAPNPPGGKTLLVYEQPVALLRLPLQDGDAWTSIGVISGGELDGLPYNGTDTYEVAVDGAGRLELPHLTFTQAHRVLTRVEVAPAVGGVTVTRRQVSFWFECFGEVARATSRNDESDPLFDRAAELRRLAL